MFTYSVMQWLFIFYFYCFFGWCFESGYVSLKSRKWVNRGFMRGPFLPLYGSGAVMMLVVSKPFLDYWWAVYLAGFVGATLLEYVTGVVMEALFKVRYWDYSSNRFQFQGHICLGSSLAWGALTLLMNYVIHKPVERVVLSIPATVLSVVTILLSFYIAGDFVLSFKAALDLRDVLVKLERVKEDLARVQKRLDVIVAVTGEDLAQRRDAITESVAQRRDAITESVAQRKDAITESVGQRTEALVDAFSEGIVRTRDALADKLRIEELKEGIEKNLTALRDGWKKRAEGYSEDTREEILDLKTEYELSAARHERLKNRRDLSRRIRNNPTMSSRRFKDVLEELKEKPEKEKAEKKEKTEEEEA